MEDFESQQSFPEEDDNEEPQEAKVPPEIWDELKIIAQTVGGDFRMKICLGTPGGGSFFDPYNISITFDPLHIIENPTLAKFVAGHEGGHRAISLSPTKLGVSIKEIIELYSQVGFGYLQNIIEDPAVNDWLRGRFPSLRGYIKEVYDQQLGGITPEIRKIIARLGYCPKFVQYGTEIIRYWHKGEFSQVLDPAVKRALDRTIEYALESIRAIPDPTSLSLNTDEVVSNAQRRFKNNTDNIWPEVRKLVEMDLKIEEERQMVRDFMQKRRELEKKEGELEKARREGNKTKQKQLEEEIERLKGELDPFEKLPREIRERIDKVIRERASELQQQIEEKQKELQEAQQKAQQLQKEIDNLQEEVQSAQGEEAKKLQQQLEQKRQEKTIQEENQERIKQELKDIEESLSKILSGEDIPYPVDKLSEETRQELRELFNKLPPQKREELRNKASKELEDLEDSLNEELEGKLNEDKPESHKQKREREEKEKETKQRKERERAEGELIEMGLEEIRRQQMTEYDEAYKEVADIILPLYNRLKKIFLAERHPKWRKGYSSGSRVNLQQAMQAEADPRYLERIWERKTIPTKYDFRFMILVDLSGSMHSEPTKLEETFKGLVVLAEVLERLGIQFEVIGFSNQAAIFKGWREKLDKETQGRLGEMKRWGGGGTPTTEATQLAYAELTQNLGKNNFLITLTDGQPNDPKSLKALLEEIRRKGGVKLVGIGLGKGTQFVKDYYEAAFSLEKVRSEDQGSQDQDDFAETLAKLLEDMIRHPEKY